MVSYRQLAFTGDDFSFMWKQLPQEKGVIADRIDNPIFVECSQFCADTKMIVYASFIERIRPKTLQRYKPPIPTIP